MLGGEEEEEDTLAESRKNGLVKEEVIPSIEFIVTSQQKI